MYELAIVGGGPAGLAAAVYAIRKGVDVQLIAPAIGGKTAFTVNFPDMADFQILKAKELVQVYRGRVEYLDHTYRLATVERVRPVEDHFELTLRADEDAHVVQAERLIIATGVRGGTLGIPGESTYLGSALGTSSISYTQALRDRRVVLIGNSDRVIEAAVEAAVQADQVCLVLEPQANYRHDLLSDLLHQGHVTVYNGYQPVRFEGDEIWARAVVIRRPTAPEKTIEADAFFVEREPQPNSELVAQLVGRDRRGYIKVDQTGRTDHPRIYAAGDVTTVGIEQVLVALGAGARAALSAYRDALGTRRNGD
jgi:alkyl hydroperoxide reductase subunit F